MTTLSREEEDILHCCGSKRFAKEMAFACRFADVHHAFRVARDIWFNKVDVAGWLEAVSAHLAIGATSPSSPSGARKSNPLRWLLPPIPSCREKFGFVFPICTSGRGTPQILSELKVDYENLESSLFNIVEASSLSPVQKSDGCVMIL